MYFDNHTVLFLDGKFVRAEKAVTHLFGQTLHYGYGVFDGLRSYQTRNGVKIFKAYEHFGRFKTSCERLGIPIDQSIEQLTQIAYQLLHRNNLTNAYLRPLAFCGPNMMLTRPIEASMMLCAWEWDKFHGEVPVKVCVSSYQRLSPQAVPVNAKICGNYVNSTLATVEARERGYDEALLLDVNGSVAETPGANFFFEKNGVLFTPPADYILAGITRASVLEICEELDIRVVEKFFGIDDILEIDSAFICGTASGIVGVESIDARPMGKPWSDSLGAAIQEAFQCQVLDKSFDHVII